MFSQEGRTRWPSYWTMKACTFGTVETWCVQDPWELILVVHERGFTLVLPLSFHDAWHPTLSCERGPAGRSRAGESAPTSEDWVLQVE